MEDLGVTPEFWRGRRVLVTGHTGFKGAWLSLWLDELGASVSGLALAPEPGPCLWKAAGLDARRGGPVRSRIADINDRAALAALLDAEAPEVVFHLAAQSLVRHSYRSPEETFAANTLGVVTLLHAVSAAPSVRAVVVVTSDKCYENAEWHWGYRETDRMGGRDPYSASKACAELAAASMRRSYFAPYVTGGHPARIAAARAGNVIGGGDWAEDRLAPDIVRGCLGPEGEAVIRSPFSVRPWQHVLEPLRGYLMLAERLCADGEGFDDGWNFGPDREAERPVIEVAEALVAALGTGRLRVEEPPGAPHEAKVLRLDAARARSGLGWTPRLDFARSVAMTADWYAAFARGDDGGRLCRGQIREYMGRVEEPA